MAYSFFARTPDGHEFKVECASVKQAQTLLDLFNRQGYYMPARPYPRRTNMIYIDLYTRSGKRVRVECKTCDEVFTLARLVWDALAHLNDWESPRP